MIWADIEEGPSPGPRSVFVRQSQRSFWENWITAASEVQATGLKTFFIYLSIRELLVKDLKNNIIYIGSFLNLRVRIIHFESWNQSYLHWQLVSSGMFEVNFEGPLCTRRVCNSECYTLRRDDSASLLNKRNTAKRKSADFDRTISFPLQFIQCTTLLFEPVLKMIMNMITDRYFVAFTFGMNLWCRPLQQWVFTPP